MITDPLPAAADLFVGDLGAPGSGPIEFIDGSGAATSGLTLNFDGLSDASDDIEFSTDGVSYAYVPVPDVDGFDPLVRFVRIRPSGTFLGATGGTPTTFDLRFRVRVR